MAIVESPSISDEQWKVYQKAIDRHIFDNSRIHYFFWFIKWIWIPLWLRSKGRPLTLRDGKLRWRKPKHPKS